MFLILVLVARCSPWATVIDEATLSQGYSVVSPIDYLLSGPGGFVLDSSSNLAALNDVEVKNSSSLTLTNLLPFRETFAISYAVSKNSQTSLELVISSNGQVLQRHFINQAVKRKFSITVGAKSSEQLFFNLLSTNPEVQDTINLRILTLRARNF